MGLLCCFAPPSTKEAVVEPVKDVSSPGPVQQPSSTAQEPTAAAQDDTAAQQLKGASSTAVDRPWSKLNANESAAVQQTLLKVSELIERFAEGSAEREAPLHALKKALQLVAADCHASYASMSVVSADQATFLVMGAVGSSHEATTIPNTVTAVQGSGTSVEMIMNGTTQQLAQHKQPNGRSEDSTSTENSNQPLQWAQEHGAAPPSDWVALQCAGIRHIHAMPIRASPSSLLAVLNLGFKHEPCLDMGFMGPHLFNTYLSLVSATLTAVVRDPGLNAYVCLARDLAAASSLDNIMQAALLGSRGALTRLKGMAAAGSHTWLRLALISGDKSAAALFDDLTLAGVPRGSIKRSGSAHGGSTSAQWVATIQAAGGLVRTNIPMKNTILRIALTNKKQVLIPDVQKLINQLGNVNTDLFASRLLRPPSSVLLLPLRASGVGIYGALYCLADVQTEFSEVAKQLKEVAELLGQGLNRQLHGALLPEYLGIQQMNHEQLLQRDGGDGSHGSFGLGGPLGLTGSMGLSHHSSGGLSPSSVTPATTAGSLPGAQHSYSTTTGSSSLTAAGAVVARSEGSFMAAATQGGALELGSTVCTNASWAGSTGGSFTGTGGSSSAHNCMVGRSFVARQVASSTNAVAAGITEKLNQKRINAAMSEPEEEQLGALQLVAQIGEGGFAKVFRGLYRGLVVAVKIVSVGDPSNERAVMKNAHEIAILRSSSHPNIIQAYSCLIDVRVRDVIALCTRHAPQKQRLDLITALTQCGTSKQPPAGDPKQQQQQQLPGLVDEEATCHIEVVEYCDLGNLTAAIRNHIFGLDPAAAASNGRHHRASRSRGSNAGSQLSPGGCGVASEDDGSFRADSSPAAAAAALQQQGLAVTGDPSSDGSSSGGGKGARLRVNMRWLLLTLLEVAEGMAYLHRMGVVHCDLKPANVLLKSSNADVRGFTAKVSDFGLSRVEDDDTCATFPFNSCGTAAYVAPEALITTKKVNASVDVFAFGIMMWELFVGQRPYGTMSQQRVVEEVVLRGLRPNFPVGTPLGYSQLACSCWHATAGQRPSFQEIVGRLQAMLHQVEDSAAAAAVSVSLTGSEAWGGRADGLGIPPVPPAAGLVPNGQQNGGMYGAAAAAPSTAAAQAAAIAEAAAAWQQHHQKAAAAQQVGQVPVAQLLAWQHQQQQAANLRMQQLQQLQQQPWLESAAGARGGAVSSSPAAAAAAAAPEDGLAKRSKSASAATSLQQQAAALAAAGSVYEFQQVGFGGEVVVGTGWAGGSRLGAAGSSQHRSPSTCSSFGGSSVGGSSTSSVPYAYTGVANTAPPAQQQQQQQLWVAAAAAAAGRGGSFDASLLPQHQHQQLDMQAGQAGVGAAAGGSPVGGSIRQHRLPSRSKTFTAGTAAAQQQQQQLNQLLSQMGYLPPTPTGSRSTTNTVVSSASFNSYANAQTSGSGCATMPSGGPEDLGALQRQAQALLQRQEAAAAVRDLQAQLGMRPPSFTFSTTQQGNGPRVGSSPVASAAAAIAAAQQKQQEQRAALLAAAAAAAAGGGPGAAQPHAAS